MNPINRANNRKSNLKSTEIEDSQYNKNDKKNYNKTYVVAILSIFLLIFFFHLSSINNINLTQQQQQELQEQQKQHEGVNNNINIINNNNETKKTTKNSLDDKHSDFHIIFSTDCKPFQDWQTLLLFYSAHRINQRGYITRIASGCTEERANELNDLYKKLYPHGRFTLFNTPDFSYDAATNKKYLFYNKPRGLNYWLNENNFSDDMVVALLDPDMIFLRPLDKVFKPDEIIINNGIPRSERDNLVVSTGHPISQTYGIGAPWATNNFHRHFNRTGICPPGSPCLTIEQSFAAAHLSVGPPYLATVADMKSIAKSWVYFVPRVYLQYPYLLAEMYAYSIAAAHEQLPSLTMNHMMVSDVTSPAEGWDFIDDLQEFCEDPVDGIFYKDRAFPTVIHYCQAYSIGEFFFSKRRVKENIFSCEAPLYKTPKKDDVYISNTYKERGQNGGIISFKNLKTKIRNGFTTCTILKIFNDALRHYKDTICDHNTANYNEDGFQ